MHTRLIRLADLTDDDVQAWQRLADHAVEPNMFLDPRFLVPARRRPEVVHDLRLVVVQEGERWLAALAVTTKPVAPGLPVRAATTGGRFATTHSDRHHPLVLPGRVPEVLAALLLGLREVGLPGLVQLQHFPADGPLAEALDQVVGQTSIRVHERRRTVSAFASRSSVLLPDGGAPEPAGPVPLAAAHLGSGRRKDLRRRVRALERAAGGALELHDVTADPAADREFVALQVAGWKGDPERGGAALALDPSAHRWFTEVVDGFRRTGDLLVLRLAAGGRTVWTGYTLRSGGTWFGFLDAYDEEHRRLSPGALGRLAELAHLFGATDAVHLDPAFESRYVTGTRLYPDRREHVDLLVSTRGLVARAAVRAAPVARRFGLGARAVAVPLLPAAGAPLEGLAALVGG